MLALVFSLTWFAVRMERTRPQKAAVEVAELDRLTRIEQEFFDKKDDFSVLYEMFMEDDELMQLGDGISSQMGRSTTADLTITENMNLVTGGVTRKTRRPRYRRFCWMWESRRRNTISYLERMDALGVREINKHGVGGYSFEASFGMLDGADVAVRYIPEEDFNEFLHGPMLSDAHQIPPKTVGGYYLPLEGNWYLYYFWHGPLEY